MLPLILAAFLATTAHACPATDFAGGVPPAAPGVVVICEDGYSLGHSAERREPLWSAEYLSAAGVAEALAAKRFGTFHPEPLLPKADRSELQDYLCAGDKDRGHMVAVGDKGKPEQENATFSLANMVPQNDELNEGLWAGIEGAVRTLAQQDDELYVVTGPLFDPAHTLLLNGRVAIPTQVWKAVYVPKTKRAAVYVAENDASGTWHTETVAELASQIGFDPMPGLPDAVKYAKGDLPAPTKLDSVLKLRTCK